MKTLLVVYHSTTGGALQMAQAAAQAGIAQEIRVVLREAQAAGVGDLLSADGYIFAMPEYLAAMSGRMKDFFDRCYYAALDRLNGRPYAMLVSAGSDGSNAVRQMERIAAGWRVRRVAPPVIACTSAQTPEAILAPKRIHAADLERCRELGAALAAGLSAGIF